MVLHNHIQYIKGKKRTYSISDVSQILVNPQQCSVGLCHS